jgi:hypothetical protein
MPSARLALYQFLLMGPVLGAVLVSIVLTRSRVRAYVRGASWLGVAGWWLLAALPWLLATLTGSFLIFGTNLLWRGVVIAFNFLVPLSFFALPFFTVGATAMWVLARIQRPRSADVPSRGA